MLELLNTPHHLIDVVLDTDAYNEIDDQFAISYMFCSQDRFNIKAIYTAPFKNKERAENFAIGMEKSYNEILELLKLLGNDKTFKNVFRGATQPIIDGRPSLSDSAKDLATRAMKYSKNNPLYVVAIAALTNIASALMINPDIANKIVVVWLGGDVKEREIQTEFNLKGDVFAANYVFKKMKNRLIQIPCFGVVSNFITTGPELVYWLKGKNELCDYLVNSVIDFHSDKEDLPWSKPIWDVTALAYLLNDGCRFMSVREEKIPQFSFDGTLHYTDDSGYMKYVTFIKRDVLFEDLFSKLSNKNLFGYLDRDNK